MISGILGIPHLNLTGCEILFVFWLLWASGRVEPYIRCESEKPLFGKTLKVTSKLAHLPL